MQDKKKSDTLRKLFSTSKGGGKGGGKGGKGGKGGGKCGIYVEEYTSSINTPTGGDSPYKRPSSRTSSNVMLPPLTYANGMPSLMCKIDLNKLPNSYVSQLSKGQELRQRTELSDTRPSSRQASSLTAQAPRPSTPEEGEIVDTPPPQQVSHHTDGDVRNRTVIKNDAISSDSKNGGAVIGGAGAANSASVGGSGHKRKRSPNGNSISNLSAVNSVDAKTKTSSERSDRKKRKREHVEKESPVSKASSNQVDIRSSSDVSKLKILKKIFFKQAGINLNEQRKKR